MPFLSLLNRSKKEKIKRMRNKTTAFFLALFLGSVGAHKFYLGRPAAGFLYILLCWTLFPAVLSLVEAFVCLFMNEGNFDRKYNFPVYAIMKSRGY